MVELVGRAHARSWTVDAGDVFVVVCGAVAVGVSLWLSRGIWAEGLPAGSDTGAHVVRSEHAFDHILRDGRLDGWQARFGLGYQQSLFIGPGLTLLTGILQLLSLGSLSAIGAIKVVTVATYAAMPLAVALLAGSFGLGRRSVGVAALLSLGVTQSLGGAGLSGAFSWGLLTNFVGALFAVLGAAGIVLILRRPSTGRVVFTAVVLALAVITHPWSTIALAVFGACFVVAAAVDALVSRRATLGPRAVWPVVRAVLRPSPDSTEIIEADPAWRARLGGTERRLKALTAAGALGAALAAVQLVPLLAHTDLKGVDANFGDVALADRLRDALAGTDHLRPYMAILVIAGAVYTVVLAVARRPLALTVVGTPVLLVVSARAAAVLWPERVVATQLTNRTLFLVGFLAVLPAALLIGEIGSSVAALRTRFGFTRRGRDRRSTPCRPWCSWPSRWP